jgi:hypothetical protein
VVDQLLAAAQHLLVDRAMADRVDRDRDGEDRGAERDEPGLGGPHDAVRAAGQQEATGGSDGPSIR